VFNVRLAELYFAARRYMCILQNGTVIRTLSALFAVTFRRAVREEPCNNGCGALSEEVGRPWSRPIQMSLNVNNLFTFFLPWRKSPHRVYVVWF